MSTRNMPGFTAEKSIYQTSDHYRAIANTPNNVRSSREVLPQLPIGFCQANCDRIQDSFLRSVCVLRCFDATGGGGGGDGGGPFCRPGCGRCLADPDSPTGRSRTCIRRNCDDYVRAC